MRFKIEKEPFLKILQRTHGIVEKRNSMPILSNILLEAKDNKINTVATDLEIFVKDSCDAQIEKEGSITINSRKFFEIIKELTDSIDISVSDTGQVTVKGGRAKFKIPGLDAKEFPAFPSYEESQLVKVDSAIIAEMIDFSLFATSTDETRYNINGVLFEKENNKIRMAATDGHRLALIEKTAGEMPGREKGIILPRKGVNEIKKLIDDKEGEIFMGFTENSAIVKSENTLINVRLIEGDFPDYNQVIPKDNDKIFTVEKEVILSSLKRVSILSADRIKGVKFNLSKGKLILSSSTPEGGEATEEVDVNYDGESIEIAFNAKYYIDALEQLGPGEVNIALKESLNPGLLKAAATEGFSYVVMPMRL